MKMAVERFWVLLSAVLLVCYGQAQADDISRIVAGAGSNTQGVLEINLAAGDFNQQVNAGAIAASRGISVASVRGVQRADVPTDGVSGNALATIADGAFSGTKGWIAINQASGRGNTQANGMAIALSASGASLADSEMGATLSGAGMQSGSQDTPTSPREVTLDRTVFQGAGGLFQVNQAAGSWNNTANNFALNVSAVVIP